MRISRAPWKLLGLAGVVGVVATGVVIARAERRRRVYTPEQVRARLRTRHAEAAGIGSGASGQAASGQAASGQAASGAA